MNIKNDFLNDLLYMACRYAIGRKSIGALMLAPDIAKYIKENYDELGEDNIKLLINDIKISINDRLRHANTGRDCQGNLMQILLQEQFDDVSIPTIDKDLMCWSDLVGAYEPNLEITLNDNSIHKGFFSLSNGKVVIKTCGVYLENPNRNIYIDDDSIAQVTPLDI